MDIKEPITWKKFFKTKTKCDFCQKSKCFIGRVDIQPVGWVEGRKWTVDGAVMSKKCWKCLEE